MPRITVTAIRTPAEREAALETWAAARRATDRSPGPVRRTRVATKIAESPVALVARYGDRVSGMALAEPYVDPGRPLPRTGHISMLFVTPAYWGCGIGSALVRALQEPAGTGPTGWASLSVWTRTDNRRGRRLYASCGFTDTGDRAFLHEGEEIRRLAWP